MFHTTRWSLVTRAKDNDPEAIATLLQDYYRPIKVVIGSTLGIPFKSPDLDDRTQDFVVKLLEGKIIEFANSKIGRFRHYLVAAIKKFVCGQLRNENAKKRGGDETFTSIDDADLVLEDKKLIDIETQLKVEFRQTVIDRACAALISKAEAKGETSVQLELNYLRKTQDHLSIKEMAEALNKTQGNIRFRLNRQRKRLKSAIEHELSQLVAPEHFEDELNDLFEH